MSGWKPSRVEMCFAAEAPAESPAFEGDVVDWSKLSGFVWASFGLKIPWKSFRLIVDYERCHHMQCGDLERKFFHIKQLELSQRASELILSVFQNVVESYHRCLPCLRCRIIGIVQCWWQPIQKGRQKSHLLRRITVSWARFVFEEFLESQVVTFTNRCMYSEKQEPEVEKAELESGNGWTFWRINCNKNGNNELCHKWGVHSFPQIGAYVFGRIVPVMSHKRGGWRLITKYIEELNAKYP